ncbi:oligopeptide transport system permease oppB [Bacillus cereus BAG1X2-3]|uniref:Peptide ABC transporter permease n=2 Tax=Bacillus cereus group TaxID=86661 RepID=A0A9X6M024_BACUH|nr:MULTISPECIES: ABC transporter permease subunit [Bacillus cereus group]EOO27223.1 oligopeptide transport system permease oppB [Bacillus cereus BAG1X1-1]EOO49653.1 oligopeptide transport system permease oppB [Bacillus cereus BAG1X2-1]EOO51341.1 oligopeptide transport system permease oppB [Bacillus cereus BAG1X2-2]EOO60323.1 oligopeptide transport system permease oppB [Bacillus cereus BAG1X2-3]EOP06572.1 oligopeptide transport system permease oppB [Bacillus cereus BAG2O-1]
MFMRTAKWCWITCLQLLAAILCIICLGALPRLFKGLQIDLIGFWNTIVFIGGKLLRPWEITFGFRDSRKLFPQIWIHYSETMLVFLSAFLLSLLIAYVLVVWVLQRSHMKQKMWNGVFLTLESIPDILLILLSQLLVVIVFQKTGFMPIKLAGLGEERVRLLPIICLTIPTTLLFIKLLLLRFKEEMEKDYSIFAKSKGLSLQHILTHHVSRNVLLTTIYYAKTNILFMLSNLYIIEWIFNTYGMFVFVKENSKLEIFTVSLVILYVPLFILFRILHTLLQNVIRERV